MKDNRLPPECTQGKLKVWTSNHSPPLFVQNRYLYIWKYNKTPRKQFLGKCLFACTEIDH